MGGPDYLNDNDRVAPQQFAKIMERLHGAISAGLNAIVIDTGDLFRLAQAAAVKWERDKLKPIDDEAKQLKAIFVPALWTMRWLPYKSEKQRQNAGADGRWQVITSRGEWIDCDFAPVKYSPEIFDI